MLLLSSTPSFANDSVITEDFLKNNYVSCATHDALLDGLVNSGSISLSEKNKLTCLQPTKYQVVIAPDYSYGPLQYFEKRSSQKKWDYANAQCSSQLKGNWRVGNLEELLPGIKSYSQTQYDLVLDNSKPNNLKQALWDNNGQSGDQYFSAFYMVFKDSQGNPRRRSIDTTFDHPHVPNDQYGLVGNTNNGHIASHILCESY